MQISVIIPTKNRPNDLLLAIKSIVVQSRMPDQIVIIDQSETSESEDNIKSNVEIPENIELTYIRDTQIKGLVEAKAKSLQYATGELVFFFEDDVVLEREYVEEIEKTFETNSKVLGCSGVIINATSGSWLYRLFYRLTHIGIFKDERPDIFERLNTQRGVTVATNIINGGLSAWRKQIFSQVPFDYFNKFHMMEDFEFSSRANRLFPGSLFINSNARLFHYYSPINRSSKIKAVQRKVFEYIVYFKKHETTFQNQFSCFVLLTGIFFQTVISSIMSFNLDYINSFWLGVKDGMRHQLVDNSINA